MSDITNTTRAPSYGKAAERFNAEQKLGAAVLRILSPDYSVQGMDKIADVRDAAEELGLISPDGTVRS